MRRAVRWLIVLCTLTVLPVIVEAQKNCKKGIPCGNTCISATKTCRVGSGSATTTPPASTPTITPSADAAEPPITDYPWVASSRGKVYYRRQCSNAKELARENRRYFATEAKAQAAGYTRSKSKGC